jgi:hypothetical protein
MNLEDMILHDGRKLPDVWPNVRETIEDDDATAFVSIPEGKAGSVLIEHGDGNNRLVELYCFDRSGTSDFIAGMAIARRAHPA